jgi:hypothetical protein
MTNKKRKKVIIWVNVKKINPKECKYYAQGYCCKKVMCGLNRNRCREIAHCGHHFGRGKCHVKIGSDTKCISFEPTKHNCGLKKSAKTTDKK